MRIKLLLFLNSEKTAGRQRHYSSWVSWLWLGAELRRAEQRRRREGRSKGRRRRRRREAGGRQGVHHKINPFTVSSGCKVRYEADMSNETLQSSKGTAIKAYIKLMELVISASIKRIERVVLPFGDQNGRLIDTNATPPSHILPVWCPRSCPTAVFRIAYP